MAETTQGIISLTGGIVAQENNSTQEPRIKQAQYDGSTGRLTLALAENDAILSFVARCFPGLESATNEQLSTFIVAGGGASIRWPDANVGINTLHLVRWVCGVHEPTLTEHMRKLAQIRTDAHREAARANGAKGGRPRKNPLPEAS